MFFGEDDGEDGGFESALGSEAALNQREEGKTARVLRELEARLYHAGGADAIETVEAAEVPEVRDEYRRYESTGYDAHTDSVQEHEIRDWQRAFAYLRIEGTSCLAARGRADADLDLEAQGVQFVAMPASATAAGAQWCHEDGTELLVQGKGQSPPDLGQMDTVLSSADGRGGGEMGGGAQRGGDQTSREGEGEGEGEGEEEVLASHGVLEEWIEMNRCEGPEEESEEDIISGDPVSPDLARRAEVISILADAVWPELVEALRPLVRRIVSEARKRNPVYPDQETEPASTFRSERGEWDEEDGDGW